MYGCQCFTVTITQWGIKWHHSFAIDVRKAIREKGIDCLLAILRRYFIYLLSPKSNDLDQVIVWNYPYIEGVLQAALCAIE